MESPPAQQAAEEEVEAREGDVVVEAEGGSGRGSGRGRGRERGNSRGRSSVRDGAPGALRRRTAKDPRDVEPKVSGAHRSMTSTTVQRMRL